MAMHSEHISKVDEGIRLDLEEIVLNKQNRHVNTTAIQQNIEAAKQSIKNLIEIRKTLTA